MSRLEVPLTSKRIWTTGDLVLRADLDLLLRDDRGVWRPETFRVDSGTEMTSMAASRAQALNLPMPQNPVWLDANGMRCEVRSGVIRARIVGMDEAEHVFPCYFVGSPDAPQVHHQPAVLRRNLLGLSGVVDKLRIAFDVRRFPAARYGVMIIETL